MSITMENFVLTWTDPDGSRRASAVAYDRISADRRRNELEKAGASDIDEVAVKPGELPTLEG